MHLTAPREATITPMKCSLIAVQAHNQWLLLQELINKTIEETTPEIIEPTSEGFEDWTKPLCIIPQNLLPDTLGLDL